MGSRFPYAPKSIGHRYFKAHDTVIAGCTHELSTSELYNRCYLEQTVAWPLRGAPNSNLAESRKVEIQDWMSKTVQISGEIFI